jgi:hypothetical protein
MAEPRRPGDAPTPRSARTPTTSSETMPRDSSSIAASERPTKRMKAETNAIDDLGRRLFEKLPLHEWAQQKWKWFVLLLAEAVCPERASCHLKGAHPLDDVTRGTYDRGRRLRIDAGR